MNRMHIPVRELSRTDLAELERHFLALDSTDRRLRFGGAHSGSAISGYLQGIDFERDALFGVADDKLRLLGVAHVARGREQAELGISVLPGHRGHGVGAALLARAVLRARNWGVFALFMHCLAENDVMMHLARTQGMEIATQAGEADAWLSLPPADAFSLFGEVFEERLAWFDFTVKAQLAYARCLLAHG